MMNVQDIRAKAQEQGRVDIGNGVYFEKSSDIDFYNARGALVAYISESTDDNKPAKDGISIVANLNYLADLITISQYFGVELKGYEPISVEKPVEIVKEIESSETGVLRGKVEAYEKILTGREFSVGK